MAIAYSLLNHSIKSLTRILCNVDDAELSKVPSQGPLIIASNHVNFIEIPILYTHLQPRRVTGFAKAETWENPLMGILFDMWGVIPLKRGEADNIAFRSALIALQQKKIVAIAPEGTRSENGKLQPGHPGIILLSYLSRAPILPMVFYGGERLKVNLNKLKRTDFHILVGQKFHLIFPEGKFNHEVRNIMIEEIMYQLANLLPQEYRGFYDDLSKTRTRYLSFDECFT
jgi:1-acyl-sn-glycerol-3-phosphate acyltransferase